MTLQMAGRDGDVDGVGGHSVKGQEVQAANCDMPGTESGLEAKPSRFGYGCYMVVAPSR